MGSLTELRDSITKSERLCIQLCAQYPEYEAYIERCHKIDPSYEQMLKVKLKIYKDLGYGKNGLTKDDWNIEHVHRDLERIRESRVYVEKYNNPESTTQQNQ